MLDFRDAAIGDGGVDAGVPERKEAENVGARGAAGFGCGSDGIGGGSDGAFHGGEDETLRGCIRRAESAT